MNDSTTTADGAPVTTDAPLVGEGRGRSAVTWIAVAALVVGALLGVLGSLVGAGILSSRPDENSPEAGFLRDMALHHAQAVEMGMIAYKNASIPEVGLLGSDIALTQHGQINIMQTWLRDWNLNLTGDQPLMAWMPDGAQSVEDGLMPGMATPAQMTALRAATGKDVDVQFLTLMRQHHLGGIHMAQEIIEISHEDKVVALAQTMVTGQEGELSNIQRLLAGTTT
jgi:uncharacterized protein (DUF305 family)